MLSYAPLAKESQRTDRRVIFVDVQRIFHNFTALQNCTNIDEEAPAGTIMVILSVRVPSHIENKRKGRFVYVTAYDPKTASDYQVRVA